MSEDWKYFLERTMVLGRDVPDVGECYGYNADSKAAMKLHPQPTCDQCSGTHTHNWVNTLILSMNDFTKRCSVCGARNCDIPGCTNRRHHRDPHTLANGKIYQVGT